MFVQCIYEVYKHADALPNLTDSRTVIMMYSEYVITTIHYNIIYRVLALVKTIPRNDRIAVVRNSNKNRERETVCGLSRYRIPYYYQQRFITCTCPRG